MKRVLFKREFNAVILGKGNKYQRFNIFIVSSIVYLFIMGIVILLFAGLIRGFSQYGLAEELLVIFLAFSVFLQIFSGIKSVIKYLYRNKDFHILQPLPIKNENVIIVKMAVLYIRELFLSMILALPLVIAYGIVVDANIYYYALLPLVLLLIPIMSLSFSVLLALPAMKLNALLERHRIIKPLIGAAILVLVFFVYRHMLNIIVGLMNENRLQFIFNVGNAERVRKFAGHLYPLNLYGKILNGDKVAINILFIILINFGLAASAVWVNELNFEKLTKNVQNKIEMHAKQKRFLRKPNPTKALYKKEMLTVFRSREMAFSYLAVLLTLPLIGYLLVSVINDVVSKMYGGTYLFPFVTLFMILLVGLTNSFACTIISKEGHKLNVLKALPVSYRKQIEVKVIFASIMMHISLIITILVLMVTKETKWLEGFWVWLIAGITSQALIIDAVNNDLTKPDFSEQFQEGKTAGHIFKTFLVGLFVSGLMFVVMLLVNPMTASFLALVLSLLYLVMNILRLNRNIDEKALRILL